MLTKLIDILFGCWHGNYSFPITLKQVNRQPGRGPLGTYVVCLDCGREMPYDWSQMRVATGSVKPADGELRWERPRLAGSLAKAQ